VRHALRILLILAVTLLLAITSVTLWLRSEGALRWALSQALQHTGGALKIGSSEGALDRVMLLKDVEWDSGSLHVHVDTLRLQWRPVALFIRRVSLSSVQADGVRVEVRSDGESKPVTFPLQMPKLPHFPVAIALGDVQVHDASVSLSPTLPPIRLDQVEFSARIDNDGIQVHGLDAQGPVLGVQGDARLAPNQAYAADAALDWNYTLPGWAPLKGHTELKGDALSLVVHQTLAAPYGADIKGTLKDAFTAPKWLGDLSVTRFALAAVHPGSPAYGGDARLAFHGDLDATAFKGDVTVRGTPFGSANARMDVSLGRKALDVRALSVALAGGGKLEAKGTLGFAPDARTTLTGSWQDLSWPPGRAEFLSPQGQFKLDADRLAWHATLDGALAGKADLHADLKLARDGKHGWSLDAEARGLHTGIVPPEAWMKPLLPQGRWQLAAHGDMDRAQVDQLTGHWLGGALALSGHYTRADRRWQATAVLHGADTGQLSSEWPGTLDAVMDGHGELGEKGRSEVQLTSLKGTLRGSPLQANGSAAFAGKDWQSLALDAKLGDDTLHLDGDGAGQKLHWKLDASSLAQAWPDASGELHSQGTLDGGTHYTLLAMSLDLSHFAWHRWQADSLQLNAHASGDNGGEATLHGAGLSLPGVHASTLDAKASGRVAHHELQVDVDSDRGALHLAGTGDYSDAHWQATLAHVDLTPKGEGTWHAASPWSLTVAPHLLRLPLACLRQDQAEVCASLAAEPKGWQAHGSIKAMPLAALQTVLPQGLDYAGTLDATLMAAGDADSHRLDLDASLSPGRVTSNAGGKSLVLLDYSGGEAHLHVNPKLTTGHVGWKLTDGGNLTADVRLTGATQQTLSGRIHGDMHDFELVPALVPQVSQAKGRLSLDVALAGTAADPRFSGEAAFVDGEVTVPRVGLHMTGLRLKLDGDGTHLKLDGTAHSGGGDLSLSADADRQESIWHVQGRIQGKDFRSVDLPEAQVDLSPDIGFTLDDRKMRIDGTVTVPYAVLRPRNLAGSVQVSPDQVIVGEEGGLPEEKWHLHSKLHIVMGDKVSFDGFGLSGRIGGDVTATDEPGHATTGNGELNIQGGQYAAYAQRLNIEYGRLMFTGGPISDPALDIRALRANAHPDLVQLGSVEQKVGVVVRGTLRQPLVTLFSDPPLPQAQMTNYLLFGTPGFEGSGSTLSTPGVVTASSLTSNTNASANQDQSLNFTVPIGGGAAAADLSIQNVQNGTNYSRSVILGKYLSPRLYVSYTHGIDDPFYFLRVIYNLSAKWILQAQTGAANSADIIYTLEH